MHVLAEYFRSAPEVEKLGRSNLPEIAVIGRSNVGKSTFINRLTNQKTLARTSATPGRTKEINLFSITIKDEPKRDKSLILADLPGFGFAKVSKIERENLHAMIGGYVQRRENLSIVCLLNDLRRAPEEEELGIRDIAFERGAIVIVVATKADKLSKNERTKALKELASKYSLDPADFLVTGENISIRPIWERILKLL
jgi:GTP-binding protein